MKPFTSFKRVDLFFGIVGIVAVIWLAIIAAPYGRSDHVDTFWFARLYQDLFLHRGLWEDWYFAPVPNYFPEIFLYFTISSFGLSFEYTTIAYSVAVLALTSALALKLAHRLLEARSQLPALVVALVFPVLLIASGEDLTNWSRNTIHYGAFFNLFFSICVMQFMSDADHFKLKTALFFLVVMLGSMSDFLFIPIFLAGAFGWLIIAYVFCGLRKDRGLVVGFTSIAGVTAGVLLYFLVTPNAYDNPVWASGISLRTAFSSIEPHIRALQFLLDHLLARPYILIALLILCFSVTVSTLRSGHRHHHRLPVYAFVLLGIVANLYVFGLGAEKSALNRYTVFATNISLFILSLTLASAIDYIGRRVNKSTLIHRAQIGLIIATCGLLVYSDLTNSENSKARFSNQLDTVACIQNATTNRGLRTGLADYDWATRLTVLSGGLIYLWPVRGNSLEFLPWLATKNGWEDREIEFVVARTQTDPAIYQSKSLTYPLAVDKATNGLGVPLDSIVCSDLTILIYR